MNALTQIQQELKAPKGRFNSFGNYRYRSCEDILESVKPLLAAHNATMVIMDEVVQVADRVYIKATCIFKAEDGTYVETTAYAREADSKKGMDCSQVTGTASSYARKYALNGLFLIDDTKDADTNEYFAQTQAEQTASEKIGAIRGAALEKELVTTGNDPQKFRDHYGVTSLAELTELQVSQVINGLRKKTNGAKR